MPRQAPGLPRARRSRLRQAPGPLPGALPAAELHQSSPQAFLLPPTVAPRLPRAPPPATAAAPLLSQLLKRTQARPTRPSSIPPGLLPPPAIPPATAAAPLLL
eukprot:SM011132S18856  [mRNA]  locus=s11132:44:420:+ [translate_table: standard]